MQFIKILRGNSVKLTNGFAQEVANTYSGSLSNFSENEIK